VDWWYLTEVGGGLLALSVSGYAKVRDRAKPRF
jgi:hypothetical protein